MSPQKNLIAGALLSLVGAAYAATSTETTPAQRIVDDVKVLAARAHQQRGADPWLLDALDSLVAKYDRPYGTPVLDESFRDGDYTRNPGWTVVNGNFWIDRSLGLRSQSQARPPQSDTAVDSDPNANWSTLLMGAILSSMGGNTQGNTQASTQTTTPAQGGQGTPAVIALPVDVGNSFALDIAFTQHDALTDPSRIEFGMLDGSKGARGYSLILRTGPNPAAMLRRVDGTQGQMLQRVALAHPFAVGQVQNISWRRGSDGNMTVLLNGQPLLQATDRGGGESYHRLGVVNRGGDFALRHVTLAAGRT